MAKENVDNTEQSEVEFYDLWDTTPVQSLPPRKIKGQMVPTERGTYQPDEYTAAEWKVRKATDRKGDPDWEYNGAETEYESFNL